MSARSSIKAAKQALRDKMAKPAVRSSAKRPVRRSHPAPAPVAPAMPAVHLISSDDVKARSNPFTKVIGGWIGRIMTQSSMRRLG